MFVRTRRSFPVLKLMTKSQNGLVRIIGFRRIPSTTRTQEIPLFVIKVFPLTPLLKLSTPILMRFISMECIRRPEKRLKDRWSYRLMTTWSSVRVRSRLTGTRSVSLIRLMLQWQVCTRHRVSGVISLRALLVIRCSPMTNCIDKVSFSPRTNCGSVPCPISMCSE